MPMKHTKKILLCIASITLLCGAVFINATYDFTEVASGGTPGSGKLRIWAKTDHKYYQTDSTGATTLLGGGGTVTNSTALTLNQLIIGAGSAGISALGSLGTTTTVLHGNASGAPSFGSVVEADLGLTDLTTANSSTTAHGFLKKLDNDPTHFINGQGAWAVPTGTQLHSISFAVDGGGAVISTGDIGFYPTADYACTINRIDISGSPSGSITVDVWKKAAGIPTVADKISASAPLTLSSSQLSQNGSLTGWTTSVSVGDVFGFNVATATTVTKVTGQIWCQ